MITNPKSAEGLDSGESPGTDNDGTPMRIDVVNSDGITVVRPAADRLDIEVASDFRAMLLSLIEQGNRRLVVDLADVSFIDSSGLGALVSALKTLKRSDNGGDVRLARVQPPVVSLLEIIRLNRVFTTLSDGRAGGAEFSIRTMNNSKCETCNAKQPVELAAGYRGSPSIRRDADRAQPVGVGAARSIVSRADGASAQCARGHKAAL